MGDRDTAVNDFVQWAGASTVRVCFDPLEPKVLLVARAQGVALGESEREIVSLESARGVQNDASDS